MAKIKYSALVSDMRNKLNGSVMSKNRYGSYVRNKVTPVNPQSSFQQNARMILGNLSSSFRELTLGQIQSWNSSAKDFPFTDIFGDIRHLTGQTLFVKLNANLEKLGLPRISDAPSPVGFPEFTLENLQVQNDNVAESGPAVYETSITFKATPGPESADYALVVYATPSMSKSRSFVKNEFRQIGFEETASGNDTLVEIVEPFNDRFGTAKIGDNVHIRVALVSKSTGQQSVPVSIQAEVKAGLP